MAKKIDWLEQFANDQYKQMSKTASVTKIAEQIIVNCSAYPNVKVGTLVDYDNNKYKVIDTQYRDKSGPGILLEKVAEMESPTATGEVTTKDGNVMPSSEEKTTNCCDPVNCDSCLPKTASKNSDYDILASFDDSQVKTADDYSEYPETISRPGGVKPIPSESIAGPGLKRVTDAPYHPTSDPGEEYALDIPDDFEDAAERTANIIDQEDAIDRTTVEGHFTWNQQIDKLLDTTIKSDNSEADILADYDDSGSTMNDADDNIDTDVATDTDTDTDINDDGADDLGIEDEEDSELPDADDDIDTDTNAADANTDINDNDSMNDDSASDEMSDDDDIIDEEIPDDLDDNNEDNSSMNESSSMNDIDDMSNDELIDSAVDSMVGTAEENGAVDESAQDLELPSETEDTSEEKKTEAATAPKFISRLAFKNMH